MTCGRRGCGSARPSGSSCPGSGRCCPHRGRPSGWSTSTGYCASASLAIRKDTPVHGELASYQQWATTVARFSFETYDLYLSS